MDRTDFQQAVFQQLTDAQALRTGEREVQLARNALLEQVQVLGAADARHDHVQVMHLARIDFGQRAGEEVRLLLVVAFKHHTITGNQQGLQRRDDVVGRQHHTIGQRPHLLQTPLLLAATTCPACVGGSCCCHDRSTILLSSATLGAIAVGHQSSNASNHYGWSNDRETDVSPGASSRVQQARNARLVIA